VHYAVVDDKPEAAGCAIKTAIKQVIPVQSSREDLVDAGRRFRKRTSALKAPVVSRPLSGATASRHAYMRRTRARRIVSNEFLHDRLRNPASFNNVTGVWRSE
jgi:hypothetical protein